METSKANNEKNNLSDEELKRLTDFFSILIQIDKRVNKTKIYEKQDK